MLEHILHHMLDDYMQLMPAAACFTAVVLGFFLIEVVGSPLGTEPLNMPAQEVVIVLAALGSLACILWSLAVPHARRQMMSRGPTIKALKRMNLLGLVCCLQSPPGPVFIPRGFQKDRFVGLLHCSAKMSLCNCCLHSKLWVAWLQGSL